MAHYTKEELGFFCQVRQRNKLLATGDNHSLFIDSQGRVWGFGGNSYGQLGSKFNAEVLTPTLLENPILGHVISVVAGSLFSLVLNSQGQVFSFGINDDGELGLGDKLGREGINLIDNSRTGKIIAITAGQKHSLLLNEQGQVFSFGSNDFGILGLGPFGSKADRPILIEAPYTGQMTAISAGINFSLLLNSQGQVFSFGNNQYGRLGLGHTGNKTIPTLIEDPELGHIVAISAGHYHALLLNSQGQVFSFGGNGSGQLGLGDLRNRGHPDLIYTSTISSIVAISAGSSHSLILNESGQVFSFGQGEYGQLGFSSLEDVKIPTLVDHPDLGQIVMISAGDDFSLIANDQGQVFSFGQGNSGQLGIGEEVEEKPVPTLIEGLVI